MRDYVRSQAEKAVSAYLASNQTNAVAEPYVWRAVQEALNVYEVELALELDTWAGYAVVHEGTPIAVFPTRRLARMFRRTLRTRDGVRGLRICSTVVHA